MNCCRSLELALDHAGNLAVHHHALLYEHLYDSRLIFLVLLLEELHVGARARILARRVNLSFFLHTHDMVSIKHVKIGEPSWQA